MIIHFFRLLCSHSSTLGTQYSWTKLQPSLSMFHASVKLYQHYYTGSPSGSLNKLHYLLLSRQAKKCTKKNTLTLCPVRLQYILPCSYILFFHSVNPFSVFSMFIRKNSVFNYFSTQKDKFCIFSLECGS